MAQELLDYEEAILSNYEKSLNYLEAIPAYQKIFFIILISFSNTLIIYYKANPSEDTIVSFLTVLGGFLILLIAIGFFFLIFLVIVCAIINKITDLSPKIEQLGLLSITLLLGLFSLLVIVILAIFIP